MILDSFRLKLKKKTFRKIEVYNTEYGETFLMWHIYIHISYSFKDLQ